MLEMKTLVDRVARTLDGKQIKDDERALLSHMVNLAYKASLIKEEGRFPSFALAASTAENTERHWTPRFRMQTPKDVEPKHIAKWASIGSATTDPIILEHGPNDTLQVVGVGRRPRWLSGRFKGLQRETNGRAFIVTVLGPGELSVEGVDTTDAYVTAGELGQLPVGTPFFFLSTPQRLLKVLEPHYGLETKHEEMAPHFASHSFGRVLAGMVFAKQGGALCISDFEALTEPNVLTPASGLMDRLSVEEDLREVVQQGGDAGDLARWLKSQKKFDDAVADIVRLSTVDGATFLSWNLSPVAFGRKLTTDIKKSDVKVIEVKADNAEHKYDAGAKGTRHKSAVAWVAEKPSEKRLVFVVSQDGDAMVVASEGDGVVLVHRFRPKVIGWHKQ